MNKSMYIAKNKWLVIGILLVCILFSYNVKRAVEFRMHKEHPLWVIDAIPPVISKMYFGHKKNYTSLTEIHQNFYSMINSRGAHGDNLDIILKDIAKTPITSDSYSLLGNDDKGIVDFVSIAFK